MEAEYARLLRQLMDEKHISVSEMSDRTGVVRQTITNMRMGYNSARPYSEWKPNHETVAKVAIVLGEPIEKWLALTGHLGIMCTRLSERLRAVTDPSILVEMNRYLDTLLAQEKPVQASGRPIVPAQNTRPVHVPGHVPVKERKKDGPPVTRRPIPQPLFTHAKP